MTALTTASRDRGAPSARLELPVSSVVARLGIPGAA